jgi:GLPGLI family protein
MKKSFILAALFIGLTITSFAQLTKGSVTYNMSFISDDPDMAMATAMMSGSKMILSFQPGASRADITMGSFGKISTVVDDKSKAYLMLMDMMGSKTAVKSTVDEMKAQAGEQPTYSVEKTSETKDVLGYKCTKAILRTDDGTELVGWYTPELSVSTSGQNYFNEQMPGFPLEFSTMAQGMTISMVASDISKSVDKSVFAMKIPEGYTEKSMDEMMMMGGGE